MSISLPPLSGSASLLNILQFRDVLAQSKKDMSAIQTCIDDAKGMFDETTGMFDKDKVTRTYDRMVRYKSHFKPLLASVTELLKRFEITLVQSSNAQSATAKEISEKDPKKESKKNPDVSQRNIAAVRRIQMMIVDTFEMIHFKFSNADGKLKNLYKEFIKAIQQDNLKMVKQYMKYGLEPRCARLPVKEGFVGNFAQQPFTKRDMWVSGLGIASLALSRKVVKHFLDKKIDPSFAVQYNTITSEDIDTTTLKKTQSYINPKKQPVIPAWLALLCRAIYQPNADELIALTQANNKITIAPLMQDQRTSVTAMKETLEMRRQDDEKLIQLINYHLYLAGASMFQRNTDGNFWVMRSCIVVSLDPADKLISRLYNLFGLSKSSQGSRIDLHGNRVYFLDDFVKEHVELSDIYLKAVPMKQALMSSAKDLPIPQNNSIGSLLTSSVEAMYARIASYKNTENGLRELGKGWQMYCDELTACAVFWGQDYSPKTERILTFSDNILAGPGSKDIRIDVVSELGSLRTKLIRDAFVDYCFVKEAPQVEDSTAPQVEGTNIPLDTFDLKIRPLVAMIAEYSFHLEEKEEKEGVSEYQELTEKEVFDIRELIVDKSLARRNVIKSRIGAYITKNGPKLTACTS